MIEILGIGCRFPGNVNSPEDFWRLLQTHQSAIGDIPEGRWAPEAYLGAAATPGKSVTFRAGWLHAVDRFDASYFRLSPREVAEMDPQQRLVLEVACEAILDANINPDRLRGHRVGVFVGAGIAEYQAMAFSMPEAMTQHTMSGNSLAVIANRLSFVFDLHGPSLTVDTACSAALTAFHLACQSIAADECDLAVVAGVNTLLSPSPFIGFSQAQMLSPRGVLAPFDVSADGFVRGEGCGAVLLGRDDRPVNEVRRVYARVLGSGVNEDGRTASMTMPATAFQAALIRQTMRRAGVNPDAVDYIEAHGTGTPVGDPSEAQAIAQAVAASRATPLPIGSAKGHVGHLETAAGIVGLTKIALCIHHRQLVPTASHTQFPPSIDGAALQLRVPVVPELVASPAPVMGVCSYGFGGANACVFLTSANASDDVAPADDTDTAIALPISAHHPEGIASLVAGFRALRDSDLGEAARWAGVALPARRHRHVQLANGAGRLFEAVQVLTGEVKGETPRVVFAFGGQGTQHPAMAHALYSRFPVFRACIDRLDQTFQRIGGYSLTRDHGFCRGDMRAEALDDVRVALPCIVMTQAALTEQLAALGVRPSAVVGHSTGEMVAAWTCSALTEDDLCRLTHVRAQLQYRMRPGAMAAWSGTPEETAALIERLGFAGQVTIAAINAPDALTLSGDPAAIDGLVQHGKANHIWCARLHVPRAYHSHHVAEILDPLRTELAFLAPVAAKVPFISSVQGHTGPVAGELLNGEYWVRNIAYPVDFAGVGPALDPVGDLVVEVSPRAVLTGYLQRICACDVVATLHKQQPEVMSLLRCAAELFVRGVDIDWLELQAPRRFVPLPRPPWRHDTAHRSAAWQPPRTAAPQAVTSGGLVITPTGAPYLSDHIVDGQVVMPGAGLVMHALARIDSRRVDDIEFQRFLPLWSRAQDTVLSWKRDGETCRWVDPSGDVMSLRLAWADTNVAEVEPVEAIRVRCATTLDLPRLYRFLSEHTGLDLRGAFRSLQEVYAGDAEALGLVRVADEVRDPEGIRTVLLDGCFQVAGLSQALDAHLRVPAGIESLAWLPVEPVREAWCHAWIRSLGAQRIVADLTIQTQDGRVLGEVKGLRLDRVASSRALRPRLFTTVYRRLGVPEDLRNLDWTAPAAQLRRLLHEDQRVCGLRILDVTGAVAVPVVSEMDASLLGRLDLLVTTLGEVPSTAPGCVHRATSLDALPGRGFDLVFAGQDDHEWSVTQGLDIVIGPTGEGRVRTVGITPSNPRFHVLGDASGWPAEQLTGDFAAADCIVDLRESLLDASETLRRIVDLRPSPALLLVVREGEAMHPSPLWGLARAVRNEHPGLSVYCVGVPDTQPAAQTATLAAAAWREGLDGDPERLWSESGWTAPRLAHLDPPLPVEAAAELRLDLPHPGQLASLRWRAAWPEIEGLRPDEVRLRIHYVSMHFKDVMLAMGMLRGFKPILGMEASGTVLAVGAQAAAQYPELRPGRQVLCVSMTTDQGESRRALFGTVAVADARSVFPLPNGISLEQGAGFLGVYATAWYALTHIGRLRAGETALIHSAAGGVGQSAVQIAHDLGAQVIGSAGSEAKREFLRTGLGIVGVLDSHQPETFVADVMRLTDGRGVDLVLNSLAGEGLRASLRCLRPGGRHVEIGKRDMLEDSQLGLRLLKDNISLHSVHLDLLAESHPAVVRALVEECAARLASGQARSLPATVFEAADVVDAFRFMASGKHQGKVLVRIPAGFSPKLAPDAHSTALDPRIPEALFAAEATQLITGGTGGLGLALARFMARRGAGRILLASRGGLRTREQQLHLDDIRSEHPHTQIEVVRLDLADPAALAGLLAREPGITGIFHAATSYHAERSTALDQESLHTWAIKAEAAWHLHELTRDRALRHFVLIGSLAGVYGNTDQAAYVAANAALHELARARRRQGLPAVALDLPILLGAGRLSQPAYIRELEFNVGKGFAAISFAEIEGLLAHVCAAPDACPAVISVDHPIWSGYWALSRHHAYFEHLAPRSALPGATADPGVGTHEALDREQIDREIRARIAFVLGASPDDIEPDVPLIDLGVDSLASLELAAWAQAAYGVKISQAELLTGFSCNAFVNKVVASTGGEGTAPAQAKPTSAPSATVAQHARDEAIMAGGQANTEIPMPGMDTPATATPKRPAETVSTPLAAARIPASIPATAALLAAPSDESARFEAVALRDTSGVSPGSVTVTIPPRFGRESLAALLAQLEDLRQVVVLRQQAGSEPFCLGMNLDEARFGEAAMSAGLEQFQRLAERLRAAPLPVICVVAGACRGGGMLFPSLATSVLATTDASFGFPEIRQGGLPGLVSVAAQARLSEAQCRRYMLTGDRFDAQTAQQLGLVDFVGTPGEVERELQRLLGRFSAIAPDLLAAGMALLPAATEETALVAMGGLDRRERLRERAPDPLVELRHQPETGVLVITLNDPTHSNAIDWAIAADLQQAISAAKVMGDAVRAVVLQGRGDHFCVGVNPYSFIRRTKDLPVLTAARVTYEIYRAFVGIRDLGVPVVCALHGKVMGGGLAAMLNADYRIAAQSTVFNYGNLPRGVCPGMLLSENLERVIGARWAMDLYLQDYTLTATQAREIGLIHELAADVASAQASALALAQRLARFPSMGVRATLDLIRPPVDEARLAKESLGIARCNVQGNAFDAGWKAPERWIGEAPGVVSGPPNVVHPVTTPSQDVQMRAEPERAGGGSHNVGIHAMELYFPRYMVRQADMERFHGAEGKYTAGLLQEAITFCGDDEDAVSMAMTAVSRLMRRYGIAWSRIGRLEVGTESLVDRSKAIKTHLMSLFAAHGQYDIEGVDTYNACYGGTAALFNTVAWCQSEAWDGRLGLVVAVDIADLSEEYAFLNGAAAVAMLVGPDAPVVMLPERGSHMINAWDFYKPVGWKDSYPLMRDGQHSIDVYMQCLDGCQQALTRRLGGIDLLRQDDYFVFHCTSTYLCKRGFDRLVRNTGPGLSLSEQRTLYQQKVHPGTLLTKQIGSTYTASTYVNLYSLFLHQHDGLADKTVCVYSYGSGATATMYRLRVMRPPAIDRAVTERLDRRIRLDPEPYLRLARLYSSSYGRFDFVPEDRGDREADVFHLERVDEWGQRYYHESAEAVPPGPDSLTEAVRGSDPRLVSLSLQQAPIWRTTRAAENAGVFDLGGVARLRGPFDPARFAAALQRVVLRHEPLRSIIVETPDGPMQRILEDPGFEVAMLDGSGRAVADRDVVIADAFSALTGRGFRLDAEIPFRASLLRLADDDHALLVAVHHIAFDGASIVVLARDAIALYRAEPGMENHALPDLDWTYRDFISWQQDQLGQAAMQHLRAACCKALGGRLPALPLPLDYPRPPTPSFRGATHEFAIPPAVASALNALIRTEGATRFAALLAGLAIAVHGQTGMEDFCLGTFSASRPPQARDLIGCFINQLPLRMDLSGHPSPRTILRRARDTAIAAQERNALPFPLLTGDLAIEMPPGHAAIQVVLILHSEVDARARALASAVDGLDIDISHRCGSGRAVRDWTFHVYEDGERLAGYLEYDTDLFTAASAQSTTDRFLQSLRLLATAADADLSQTIAAAEPDRTRP